MNSSRYDYDEHAPQDERAAIKTASRITSALNLRECASDHVRAHESSLLDGSDIIPAAVKTVTKLQMLDRVIRRVSDKHKLYDLLYKRKRAVSEARNACKAVWDNEPIPEYCDEDRRESSPCSYGDTIRDLMGLYYQYGNLHYRDHRAYVVTDEIVLNHDGVDYEFGQFRVCVNIPDLYLYAQALTPNYSKPKARVCHPHVDGESICMGDGVSAREFQHNSKNVSMMIELVISVLVTYGDRSPYVELENWHSRVCCVCNEYHGDEDRECDHCGRSVCERHEEQCSDCGDMVCNSCAVHVNEAYDCYCESCISRCPGCDGRAPTSYLADHDNMCEPCVRQRERQQRHRIRVQQEQKVLDFESSGAGGFMDAPSDSTASDDAVIREIGTRTHVTGQSGRDSAYRTASEIAEARNLNS